ncbi:MAG: hypothetical protein A3J30_03640 [Candidatus Wildermuthbacteria bacterium RIFCSPLOWO2_02_FULL_47_9c]|uniref:Uncharacterized protein n=2 Tax=Parcubacteria group TaxID=1794811 RepID=A0A837INF5_9BACT|nr:MAG: hypothetical protein UY25_C0005G0040 [Candidatus Yanofskybacteria bacterium GW2011_GWC1_48_11]KKW04062.1 MAG: hypothetical protein UY38_C0002G0216 [Parcubacteria group bacterium GW2011_GWB1_49_12]KKW08836.1 MAG: hypothetical protein UY45_C0003G0043 [Parcubacteria group bacterium GW2011_GWA1_49_26]OHA61760.1 MAG: hypothetical protein A2109_00225 [Candidatus Wildermuthbacteria bacterium GWA1_49_26]OHA65587.1 MAG: hypothetical protein A2674_03140 [Candidatus Wildermuthbacteria bacterium RI
MRPAFLSFFAVAVGFGFLLFPYASPTHAQAVFEDADATVETSLLPAGVNPAENAFTSFGNDNGNIRVPLAQPAISPQENTLVSWGNADATIHSIPRPPLLIPSINYEELLAEKFRPILYLHEDERFKPQEIQVVLDTATLLKGDSPVLGALFPLTEEFLSAKTDSDFKLDLLGDIFIPDSPVTNETYNNTAYIHITQDEGRVVLQYWFFYYYNDWEGSVTHPIEDFQHEGDWEFIQLIFPGNKAIKEIVEENIPPAQAVYSAHAGGYKQNWDVVDKDGTRPEVYVAKGSHANYFRQGVCDLPIPLVFTPGNTDEARNPESFANLLVSQPIVDPVNNTQFEWLLFGGLWGVNSNSPKTPSQQELLGKSKWNNPVGWATSALTQLHIITWDNFYLDRCDGDFDGIWNNVDAQPDDLSDDFDAPGPFGRKTSGTITNKGDRDIQIKDAEIGGVQIGIGLGSKPAIIDFDQFICWLFPQNKIITKVVAIPFLPFAGIVTCGSAELAAEEGSAEFSISFDDLEVVATVSAGQTLKYDIIDDQLQIETSGEGEVPLTINGKSTTIQAGEIFSVQEIQIDIKPGSDRNPINCKTKGNGVIPVAILTTENFDATTVNHTTAVFEGAMEIHANKKTGEAQRHEEDVDKDGDTDLVFHFRQNETIFTCESTKATLTGKTFDADLFIGSDSIDTKNK